MKLVALSAILGLVVHSTYAKWPPKVEPNSPLFAISAKANMIEKVDASQDAIFLTIRGIWTDISKTSKIPRFQNDSKEHSLSIFSNTEEDQSVIRKLRDIAVALKGHKADINIETYVYMSRGGILLLDLRISRITINAAEQDAAANP